MENLTYPWSSTRLNHSYSSLFWFTVYALSSPSAAQIQHPLYRRVADTGTSPPGTRLKVFLALAVLPLNLLPFLTA